jgi:hypothetical protein
MRGESHSDSFVAKEMIRIELILSVDTNLTAARKPRQFRLAI